MAVRQLLVGHHQCEVALLGGDVARLRQTGGAAYDQAGLVLRQGLGQGLAIQGLIVDDEDAAAVGRIVHW